MNKSISRARLIRAVLAGVLLVPLLFALGGCWLLSAFNETPTAAFTVNAQAGQAPFAVNFSATLSEDEDGVIIQFEWDFGDGTSGSGENVTHTYTTAGTFTVVLRVTDDDGDTATNSKPIWVSPAEPPGPTASFTRSPNSGTSPMTVFFDASASVYDNGAISSYEWAFGDGSTGFGRNPSHTYFSTGSQTYTVTLTVRGSDGKTGTATGTVSISAAGGGTTDPDAGDPSARFDIDDATGVAPHRVELDPTDTEADDGRTIVAYIWSFGDGSTDTTLTPELVNHTFFTDEADENFSITLIVTDDGNPAGSDIITKTVRVENYQPTAGFEVSNETHLVAGTRPVATVATDWWTGEDDGDDDETRVSYTGVTKGPVTLWLRSMELDEASEWIDMDRTVDPLVPAGDENDEPDGEYATFDDNDPNYSFDPEGQDWDAGGAPAWFPNDAWGIQYLRINWGDGNIENVPYETPVANGTDDSTEADHDYNFTGNVQSFLITVTAVDFLGGEDSYSRTVTFSEP